MRDRSSDRASYAAPVGSGSVMVGGTVSQVMQSKHPQFSTGDAECLNDVAQWLQAGKLK